MWILLLLLLVGVCRAQTFRVVRVAGPHGREAREVKSAIFAVVEYYRREKVRVRFTSMAKPSKVVVDCADPTAHLNRDRYDIVILPKGCGFNGVVGNTVVVRDLLPYAIARDVGTVLGLGFASYRDGGNPMTIMGSSTDLKAARFTAIERAGLGVIDPPEITRTGKYRYPFKIRFNDTWIWVENGYVEMGELRRPNRLVAFGTFVSGRVTVSWPDVWFSS